MRRLLAGLLVLAAVTLAVLSQPWSGAAPPERRPAAALAKLEPDSTPRTANAAANLPRRAVAPSPTAPATEVPAPLTVRITTYDDPDEQPTVMLSADDLVSDPGASEPALTLIARVFTPDGIPVVGAQVELLQAPTGVEVDLEAGAAEARYRAFRNHANVPVAEDRQRTDSNGESRLAVGEITGDLHLRARHPDHCDVILPLRPPPTEGQRYNLFLGDGATVRASLQGPLPPRLADLPADRPSHVIMLHRGSERRPQAQRSTPIEAAGEGRWHATLSGIPAGTWHARVMALLPHEGGSGWVTLARWPRPLELRPGAVAEIDFLLPATDSGR